MTEACLEEHDRGLHERSSIGGVGCGELLTNTEDIEEHIDEEHEQKESRGESERRKVH